jgi:hypothetical protein
MYIEAHHRVALTTPHRTSIIRVFGSPAQAARRWVSGRGYWTRSMERAADTGPGPWNGPRKVHPLFDHGVRPGPISVPLMKSCSYRQRWTEKKNFLNGRSTLHYEFKILRASVVKMAPYCTKILYVRIWIFQICTTQSAREIKVCRVTQPFSTGETCMVERPMYCRKYMILFVVFCTTSSPCKQLN